jgi:capsule polysaccharide modification protein KpsS
MLSSVLNEAPRDQDAFLTSAITYMEVSGQFHAPAGFTPRESVAGTYWTQKSLSANDGMSGRGHDVWHRTTKPGFANRVRLGALGSGLWFRGESWHVNKEF